MSKKKAVVTKNAPGAIGPYSQGICVGDFVFVSGQTPIHPETGDIPATIEEQTEQTLKNVAAVLAAGGSCMTKAVKLTVFLKDMNDFAAMNAVYQTFFEGVCPARSTVEVARLPMDVNVEIEAIGVKYEGRLY
jgi:2-iminobutanoate/2-iminopropanoate deaminase